MSFTPKDTDTTISKSNSRRESFKSSKSKRDSLPEDYLQFKANSSTKEVTSEVRRQSNYSSIGTHPQDDFSTPLAPLGEGRRKSKLPKIGLVKEGFHILKNSNPISRYNFFIERYNEDINKVNSVELSKVKMPKFFLTLFDFLTWIRRINYAIFLMLFSCMSENCCEGAYRSVFQYYSYYRTKNFSKRNYNIILLILSLISNSCFFLMLFYCFYLLVVPLVFLFIVTLVSLCCTHCRNNKMVKAARINIFNNMLYDKELTIEKGEKFNDYITVLPRGLEDFHSFHYFNELCQKYRFRKPTIPQQFMIYGDFFKNEWTILERTMVIISLELFIVTLLGSIIFVYVT